MARTKQRKPALAGRDTFHVMAPEGELAAKSAAPHALVVAQGRAEGAGDEVTLTVERRSLFGPSTTLYSVVRGADGIVRTYRLDPQD